MSGPTGRWPWAWRLGRAWRGVAEWLLVLVVFSVHTGWPAPEPNEPYYLSKAIHYWQPDWIEGDFFLDTADAHTVFYLTFGWLALWLGPTALAWTGRAITWSLLAWAWRRLSLAVVPRRWWSVLSAAVLVTCLEHGHMAGEWLIGGVEAKGFAYLFVVLALADLVRQRWTRCWILLGIASALHVLVGGWAVVATAVAWRLERRRRPSLTQMLPGLAAGGLIALLGLLPVLLLNRGTPAEVVTWANEIYVYVRLGHHLTIEAIPPWFLARFVLLTVLWLMLWRLIAGSNPAAGAAAVSRRLLREASRVHRFVVGAVVIAAGGALISWLRPGGMAWSAALLRFYWFRLADVAVPIGAALATTQAAVLGIAAISGPDRPRRPRWAYVGLSIAALITLGSATYLLSRAGEMTFPQPPRAFRISRHRTFEGRLHDFIAWRDVCRRIAASEEIPRDGRFLTPRLAQTFKWYARRPEVVNWKEIPQDAAGIVRWWRRIRKIHAKPHARRRIRWYNSLARQGPRRLRALGRRYDADYAVTFARPPLPLPVVLRNDRYVVYRLDGDG
ncbi:MAG: DUF6798 domain-containing protein [Pirellulales bacterium]